jgi:hypothetical protein
VARTSCWDSVAAPGARAGPLPFALVKYVPKDVLLVDVAEATADS